MMNAICRGGLFGLAVLAGGLMLARPVAAQIKDTADRLRIEAEKLEGIVREAINRADQVGKTQPKRAVEIVDEATAQLSADREALTKERREILLRKLEIVRRGFSDRADNPVITPGPTRIGPTRSEIEAKRAADEAARQKAESDSRFKSGKDQRAMLDDLKRQRGDAFLQSYNSILKSTIPEYRDISFPRDWEEKSKRRSQAIRLTELEKKIVKALGTPMTIEFEGKTFKEVLDFLKEKTGVPIIVDQRALDDLNITYNTPISINLRNVTTRTVLKRLLADLNLTYVMKDEAIQITTPARAKEMLTVRVYSVADLMPAADLRMPAFLSQIQAYQTLQMLVVLITQTVEPDSWEVNGKGGAGTIQFDPIRFGLIVKQTAEMHYLLGLSAGFR